MVGYYTFGTPTLLVNDLDIAKQILIKDFDHFADRRDMTFSESDSSTNKYWNNQLLVLEGEKWRKMRSAISPVFTSGKLKGMSKLINKVKIETIAIEIKYSSVIFIHRFQRSLWNTSRVMLKLANSSMGVT
jgi:cytochrome P450 family 6